MLELRTPQWNESVGSVRCAACLSPNNSQWGTTPGEERELQAENARGKPTRGGMDDHGAMGTDKIRFEE